MKEFHGPPNQHRVEMGLAATKDKNNLVRQSMALTKNIFLAFGYLHFPKRGRIYTAVVPPGHDLGFNRMTDAKIC